MSYPSIGMKGIVPGDKWDADTIEKMLRGGHGIHIYFEYPEDKRRDITGHLGVAWFKGNEGGGAFQFVSYENVRISAVGSDYGDEPKLIYETDSFLEFVTWLAFMGRDFL